MRTMAFLLMLLISSAAGAEPMRVFVSVLPQKTFVEKVGGARVEVRVMVQPGYSPHTYDPTPQQISALTKTALYIRTGVPFEHAWMDRIRSVNPDMHVMDARAGIDLNAREHPEHNSEHQLAVEPDPHVWTNPLLVKHIASNIRDKLIALDAQHTQEYNCNYESFAAELDVLDRDIRKLLGHLTNRKFMVYHPAWSYFADAYGLIQIPIEHQGKEPGARALTALIGQARRAQVKIIFVQPQFDQRFANQVAKAIGGHVIAVDPLAADYVDNLRHVAHQVAAALQP